MRDGSGRPTVARMSHDEEDSAEASEEQAQEGGSPLEQDAERDAKAGDEFKPWDELHEAFGDAADVHHVMGADGLPEAVVDNVPDAVAHPFTEEMFVCVADRRKFVIRGAKRRVIAEIDPKHVVREEDGRFYAPASVVGDALLLTQGTRFASEYAKATSNVPLDTLEERATAALIQAGALPLGIELVSEDQTVVVEPVRPQCKHLLQQIDPLPVGTVGYKYGDVRKYCMLRRTLTGAFLSLTNEAVKACSMRDPYDAPTADTIDRANAEKIAESRHRVYLPLFNVTHTVEKDTEPAS